MRALITVRIVNDGNPVDVLARLEQVEDISICKEETPWIILFVERVSAMAIGRVVDTLQKIPGVSPEMEVKFTR